MMDLTNGKRYVLVGSYKGTPVGKISTVVLPETFSIDSGFPSDGFLSATIDSGFPGDGFQSTIIEGGTPSDGFTTI